MANKKTQIDLIMDALKRNSKRGLTDEQLTAKTGIVHANTIRSKLAKQGVVAPIGTGMSAKGRTVKTWALATA